MNVAILRAALCAAVVGLTAGAWAEEEVAGRTWDKLEEITLPDDSVIPTPLTAAQVASLGGRQIELCMIGDSITWAQRGDYWRKWLIGDMTNLAFVGTHTARFGYSHAGEGGNSTAGVINRLNNPLRIPDSDYYHLLIGINDSGAAKTYEQVPGVATNTADRIVRIVDALLARSKTKKVFLGSILPGGLISTNRSLSSTRDAAGSACNAILRDRIKAGRFPADRFVWIEYETTLRAQLDVWNSEEYLPDALHPSEKGYKVIADMLAEVLQKETAVDESVPKAARYGVRVENLWNARTSLTRALIPGWYVLSFVPQNLSVAKAHVHLYTDATDLTKKFDKEYDLDVGADGRCQLEFMTEYEGYGYTEMPFHIDFGNCTAENVMVEKMRPSRAASVFGYGTFVDTKSPIAFGERLEAAETPVRGKWFGFDSAGYAADEALSDKGAYRGTWGDPSVPVGGTAVGATVGGRASIAFSTETPLTFTASRKSGDGAYESTCDVTLYFESISDQGAWTPPACEADTRAGLVIGRDSAQNPAYFGYTAGGWVQLSATGVTAAFDTWVEARVRMVPKGDSLEVTYLVKTADGYVKLAAAGGQTRFACAGTGRSWREVQFQGDGAFEGFGANNGAGFFLAR